MSPSTANIARRWVPALAALLLGACTSAATSLPEARAHRARLTSASSELGPLKLAFERANPAYAIDWMPEADSVSAVAKPRVLFVQAGAGTARMEDANSEFDVGDIVLLAPHQTVHFTPAADLLVFTVPDPLPEDLPSIIRPDWDPAITDTPGGCATETGAYRRILLTWQGKNGPYLYHALNAHRVRVVDSFTHYHPLEGGFDEFYLVQMAQPGARLIIGENLEAVLDPGSATAATASVLLREIPVATGTLIYLPRGVVHRGVGGILAQVISAPGFVPGSEIGVDAQLRAINERLGLTGSVALPVHEAPSARVSQRVEVQPLVDRIRFTIDGRLFTEYRFDGRFPAFFPVRNPAENDMTRAWPFEEREGENQDHPHHRSLWFAHGDMNGVDFWHDSETVVSQRQLLGHGANAEAAWFEAANTWVDGKGHLICTDERRVTAFTTEGAWGLDTDITVTATRSGLTFGDTKEGTFAIRLASGLVADRGATLSDSEGHEGRDAWGKRSSWMLSTGTIGGRPAAVAIFDHADNPRYPTTWHARTYGLVAANPFGLSAFENKPAGAGAFTLGPGESVRFRHRFLFFDGHPGRKTLRDLSRAFHAGP
jgi:hypothetical protein